MRASKESPQGQPTTDRHTRRPGTHPSATVQPPGASQANLPLRPEVSRCPRPQAPARCHIPASPRSELCQVQESGRTTGWGRPWKQPPRARTHAEAAFQHWRGRSGHSRPRAPCLPRLSSFLTGSSLPFLTARASGHNAIAHWTFTKEVVSTQFGVGRAMRLSSRQ